MFSQPCHNSQLVRRAASCNMITWWWRHFDSWQYFVPFSDSPGKHPASYQQRVL
jgi:hypothetical protein